MSRYTVERAEREAEELLVLHDTATGASVHVWPGCGNNCLAATLPAPDGRRVTVIQDPPALDEIRRRPSWWGIPLLFPFPGAIPGGEYEFEGQRLRLGRPEQPVVPEGREAAGARRDFHGFVMDLPWRVTGTAADAESASVTSTLDSAEHPETLDGFPFPYRVEAEYRLNADGLRLRFRAHNPGPGRLPFGFGAHPFLRLPLGERGTPGECLIQIPAARRWDSRALRRALEAGSAAPPSVDEVCPLVPEALDLRSPKPFVERTYNGLHTDLKLRDGRVEAFVRDPVNGLEAVMQATPNFRNVVFWSPPGRPELCLEPWTCPSNVFNLAARGVHNHGLTVLDPGQTWEATMWIRLRAAATVASNEGTME
jgi:aldose 1-epimerase